MDVKLLEYLDQLGWSWNDLTAFSGISPVTMAKVRKGEAVTPGVAQKIAKAISEGMRKRVLPGEIEDLGIYRR